MIEQCEKLLEVECGGKVFVTNSCTAALEIACMLVLEPGDEVIVPSWAHPANVCSVVRAGGVPVFVDVDENLNIDPIRAKEAIGPKTKAIMPVHYAGVLAENLKPLADRHGLYLIEDAAQAIGNWRVTGDFGCLSFHATKNVQCGEGGALVVNNLAFLEKAEQIISWGTDKARFNRGEAKTWNWHGIGSSYGLSRYAAEHLYEELQDLDYITIRRQRAWDVYETCLGGRKRGNGHLYWFETANRAEFIHMAERVGIKVTRHFDALHMTPPGRKYGRVGGPIERATRAMERLVKLNTNVTEEQAIVTCKTLFPERTLHA